MEGESLLDRVLLRTRFDAVVMVADEDSLFETAEHVKPMLLLVDLGLAKKDVARWISRLNQCSPGSKVIVMSVHDEPAVARAVIEAGADGFRAKRCIKSELMAAIDAAPRGACHVSSSGPCAEGA